jgi:Asp-tRNA(Asn)/Glu-tRNA(Gln) amidotransferase A subunit family amidase
MTYENRPMKAPRLAGNALKLAVMALEGPLGRPIAAKTLRDMGVDAFRRERVDAPAMPWPEMPQGTWTGAPPDLDPLLDAPSAARGFSFTSALDLARAYREGRTDPVAVTERLIAHVEASERTSPALRILIAHDKDDAIKQARAAKQRLDAKQPRSLLDGVPVAVKDEVDMVPYPTTVGTTIFGTAPAQQDAFSVSKLRAAGALLFGKTNMHEIGINPTGVNPHHGSCRNPYGLRHDTGGSSSGVAAAVAAGIAPLGLGADGGGSIRVPASHCGVFGLKPTFGRVSERGAAHIAWSVGHLGPIGATALDVALGYALIAGRDDEDLADVLRDDVAGIRVGVYRPWFDDCDAPVRMACNRMLAALSERGAQIVEIEIPKLHQLQLAHILTIVSEMRASQLEQIATQLGRYALNTRMIFALVDAIPVTDYVHAQRVRAQFHRDFQRLFERVDVIATPTSACTAPPLRDDMLETGESDVPLVDKIMRYVRPANFLGLPSISVPAGYDEKGLPIGFMLTGRAWEEALLLRIARNAESMIERRAPQVHWPLLAG